jgi:hypothetical protein
VVNNEKPIQLSLCRSANLIKFDQLYFFLPSSSNSATFLSSVAVRGLLAGLR